MVFLVTFLSINKKVTSWGMLVGVLRVSSVFKFSSEAEIGPHPCLICRSDRQASVPLHLERDDLSGYSSGIVIKLDPRIRGDDSEFLLSLSFLKSLSPVIS